MVTLIHTLAPLVLWLPAPPLEAPPAQDDGREDVQDDRGQGTLLRHAPEPGSGQIYEVRTSLQHVSRETDQWLDGKRGPGRTNLTGVGIEQTLLLYDHFPGGDVLLRREILGLEHSFTVTVTGDRPEKVSRARGYAVDTGREFELRRVPGGPPAWRLLPLRNPVDDLRRVSVAQLVDQVPLNGVLDAFPREPLLSGLLPPHPVAVGEHWEVSTKNALAALYPVGDLPVALVHEDGTPPALGYTWFVTPAVAMRGVGESECSAELLRFEERDGRHLAVIAVELSMEVVADLRQHFAASGAKFLRAGSEWSFEGRGELIWDVRGARAVQFTLSGEVQNLWDFRFNETTEARQLVSGRFTVRLRETRQ